MQCRPVDNWKTLDWLTKARGCCELSASQGAADKRFGKAVDVVQFAAKYQARCPAWCLNHYVCDEEQTISERRIHLSILIINDVEKMRRKSGLLLRK